MKLDKKILYIEWDDVISHDDAWRTEEEALDWAGTESSIVSQLGFLIDKDENYITICNSYISKDFIGGITRIPVGMIRYMKEISIDNFKA